jgi:predicted deacylase
MEYLAQTVLDLHTQIEGMNSNYVKKEDFKDLEIRVRKLEQQK